MRFKIPEPLDNKTVLEFLQFYHVGRAMIHKVLMKKAILYCDTPAKRTTVLQAGSELEIDLSKLPQKKFSRFPGELDIIYEDEDLLIVNKPPYRLVHPDGNNFNTLCNAVANYYATRGLALGVYPIHRLDYKASGIVVFAKHFLALSYLDYNLRERKIAKEYVALTTRPLPQKQLEINRPLAKDRHNNRMRVAAKGQSAQTTVREAGTEGEYFKQKITIKEGRKHQIRVHLASIGLPIVGDDLYGGVKAGRMMLHASSIAFLHPRTLKPFKCSAFARFLTDNPPHEETQNTTQGGL